MRPSHSQGERTLFPTAVLCEGGGGGVEIPSGYAVRSSHLRLMTVLWTIPIPIPGAMANKHQPMPGSWTDSHWGPDIRDTVCCPTTRLRDARSQYHPAALECPPSPPGDLYHRKLIPALDAAGAKAMVPVTGWTCGLPDLDQTRNNEQTQPTGNKVEKPLEAKKIGASLMHGGSDSQSQLPLPHGIASHPHRPQAPSFPTFQLFQCHPFAWSTQDALLSHRWMSMSQSGIAVFGEHQFREGGRGRKTKTKIERKRKK